LTKYIDFYKIFKNGKEILLYSIHPFSFSYWPCHSKNEVRVLLSYPLSPESFSPCCNCPYCVSQRGGFLSACGCHERTESSSENMPLIKRAFCFCGSSNDDFDLPGAKYPILLVKSLFPPPALEIHPFFQIPSTLVSQIFLPPPEHPS